MQTSSNARLQTCKGLCHARSNLFRSQIFHSKRLRLSKPLRGFDRVHSASSSVKTAADGGPCKGRKSGPKANSWQPLSIGMRSLALTLLSSALNPIECLAAEQHNGLFAIADLDPKTAGLIATILNPVLTLAILLFIFRIPMSWYPNLNFRKFPWAVVVVPTEPLLGPTRKAIPPVGGVDIAPIIWVAVLSFINEILLGPQGILNLIQRQLQV